MDQHPAKQGRLARLPSILMWKPVKIRSLIHKHISKSLSTSSCDILTMKVKYVSIYVFSFLTWCCWTIPIAYPCLSMNSIHYIVRKPAYLCWLHLWALPEQVIIRRNSWMLKCSSAQFLWILPTSISRHAWQFSSARLSSQHTALQFPLHRIQRLKMELLLRHAASCSWFVRSIPPFCSFPQFLSWWGESICSWFYPWICRLHPNFAK